MNIIIVDDENDSLIETENCIKKYGKINNYVLCSNAKCAIKSAEETIFDIALLDIELPDMNGFELAEKLKSIYPNIKVAFITAYNNYAAEAFDIGAVDYILKPIRQERLFRTLDKIVAKVNKIKELESKKVLEDSQLRIQMFDKFMIIKNNQILKWNRQKSVELIAYLVQNTGKMIHKEELCDLLWSEIEPKKALVNLQTTIYSIRKTLSLHNCNEISIDYKNNHYIINLKNTYVDSENFEKLFIKAFKNRNKVYCNEALKIYIGNYLDKDGWVWAEPKKQELYKKYVMLAKLLKII
jgi:two-component system LytT family response regulator